MIYGKQYTICLVNLHDFMSLFKIYKRDYEKQRWKWFKNSEWSKDIFLK